MAKNASFSSLFSVQSKSISVNFIQFSVIYQGYSLTFWPNMPHFHHFSVCNQTQSINFGHLSAKYQGYCLIWPNILIFITFECAIKINQFQFWFFRQNTKVIALLFGQKCLIFITFQQSKSINVNSGDFSANYQGYSLTVWPKMSFSSLFSVQSNSINVNFGHLSAKYQGYSQTCLIFITVQCAKNTKVIALLYGQKCLIFITFQCAIKINGINQTQSISILVIYRHAFFGKIPRL